MNKKNRNLEYPKFMDVGYHNIQKNLNNRNLAVVMVLLLVLLAPLTAFSQHPDFQYYYSFWNENYIGSHTIELTAENGRETECYFVAICDYFRDWYVYEQESVYPAKVLKLSPEGEFLGELTIGEEGRRSVIDKLFHDPENAQCILAMGKIRDKEEHYDKPFLAKFDKELNAVWQREIDLPEPFHKYFYGASVMMDSHGDIVYCTAPYETNSQGPVSLSVHRLYFRLSTEGDVLLLSEYPEESDLLLGGQGNLFEYTDGSGDYGQAVVVATSNPESNTKILRMNPYFEIVDSLKINSNIHLYSGTVSLLHFERNFTKSFPDGSFVLGCDASYFDFNTMNFNEIVAMLKVNAEDSIVNMSFSGLANDSLNKLANSQGGDAVGEILFYCNGSYDKNGLGINGPNRFIVTKTDAEANIIWQRYYQDGVQIFQPCSVMATIDEGCLVTGNCWVYEGSESNVFVLKFFSDGTLSVPELEQFVRPYAYYPNPAQDELHLQYSPDVKPGQIELFDIQGRLVRLQRNSLERLNLQGLPTGTYTMRVTLEDGKVFSDKVIKE